MERVCSLTLDLEADHGWARPYRWDALARTGALQALLDAHSAPLTTFATGESLAHASPLWAWLEARGDEIGLHSHSHPTPTDPFDPDDVRRAVAAYRQRFDRDPGCWRPPYGRLKVGEPRALREVGIRRVSTFHDPQVGLGLDDRPVSRVMGIPLGLSWLMVVGRAMVHRLPDRAVLVMHLHDVVPTEARAGLPLPLRGFYALGARHGDPLAFLARLLTEIEARGTRFVPLWEPS
jgi:peptidoglycan/xylan/chitin deacetylase (PgdA/CDA1 family)